MYTETMHS